MFRRGTLRAVTFLPVAARELRVASRQWRTYLARMQAGLAALLLGGYFLLMVGVIGLTGGGGQAAFIASGVIAFYVCLFIGATTTADSLSSEKREGTLGLLFLTDLRAYDILAGKLAAHGLHLLYLLLGTVPAFALPLLAGGVSAGSVALQASVLVNTLFFSCAAGLFVSVYARHARRARTAATLLVLGLTALPYLLSWWGSEHEWPQAVMNGVLVLSPGFSQAAVFGLPPGGLPLWPGFLVTHLYGWALLGLTVRALPRSWQDRQTTARGERFWTWWRGLQVGRGSAAVARRSRLLSRGPFHYLISRSRLRHVGIWVVLALVFSIFVLLPRLSGDLTDGGLLFGLVVCHLLAKGGLTSDAAAPLIEQRKSGAFELLLTTPLSVGDILRGQWWTLCTKYAGPVGVVLLGHWWVGAQMVSEQAGMWSNDDLTLCMAILIGSAVMLLCDLAALGWTAMWLAMSASNPQRATGDTIARILVLPWLVLGAGSAALGILTLTGIIPPTGMGPFEVFWIWLALGLATDIGFGLRARALLRERFRLCAEQQFLGTAPGWLDRLFRVAGRAYGRTRSGMAK